MTLTSSEAPSAWGEFFKSDNTLLCVLYGVFDKATVSMIHGSSYCGRELGTHSVEVAPRATKVRGMQPKEVQIGHKL